MKRLLLAAMCVWAGTCHAEQIVMQDGTVVRGELVDFQNGVYTVKVGKFLKTIPETRIADVRPDGAVAPAQAAPLATPVPAAQPLPGARPAGTQPIPGGAALPSMDGAMQMLKGAAGGQQVDPRAVNDTLKKLGTTDPGISSAVQQMISGGGIDMGAIQQLQNSPEMGKMIERFRDPNYQRSLIDGLREMQGQEGQPNPMVDQLQGLFQQLNTLQGQGQPRR